MMKPTEHVLGVGRLWGFPNATGALTGVRLEKDGIVKLDVPLELTTEPRPLVELIVRVKENDERETA